jgi:hypothetical protein
MSAELFAKIARINPTLHGWCSDQRAIETAAVVLALRPKNVTVIGVWGGRDTIAAALACRAVGSGSVIAIDPWAASASIEGQLSDADKKWWGEQEKHDAVYRSFVRAMNDNGLGPEVIDVRRAKSDAVEPPKEIGLLISDGNHGVQSIRDIERYAPNVTVGGFAYLDDLNWTGGAVMESVQKLISLGFMEIGKRDTGAWFQRVSKP